MRFRIFLTALTAFLAVLAPGQKPFAEIPAYIPIEVTTGNAPGGVTASVEGESVTASGNWSVVTGETNCNVFVYRFNYATMAWVQYGDSLQSFTSVICLSGDFGYSSSMEGDVLVVGLPSWDSIDCSSGTCVPRNRGNNNFGGIEIFVFDGTVWERMESFVSDPNTAVVEVGNSPQRGARFGESVSISRNPSNDNEYLILVGAPYYDGSTVDDGRVTGYTFTVDPADVTNSVLNQIGAVAFSENGALFGASVFTDWPNIYVGAPFSGSYGTDAGWVRQYEYDPGGPSVGTIGDLGGNPSEFFGVHLSFSGELGLVGGDDYGYPLEPAEFQVPPWDRIYEGFNAKQVATNGGDVSQSLGLAAFGDTLFKARLFRDVVEDSVEENDPVVDPTTELPDDQILIDVTNDFSITAGVPEVGADISLAGAGHSLWFANATDDRALLYQFPCGTGIEIPDFVWTQVALPCDIGGLTVDNVFGNLGVYGFDYLVVRYNESNVTSNQPYVTYATGNEGLARSNVGNPAGSGPGNLHRSFLVLWDGYRDNAATPLLSRYLSVQHNPPATMVDPLKIKFTKTQTPPSPEYDSDPQVLRTQTLELPDATLADGVEFARVMLNNPFPQDLAWDDIRYQDPAGNYLTLTAADTGSFVSETLYVYDPDVMVGQPYRIINASTPGIERAVPAYKGFWAIIRENGKNPPTPANGHNLIVPFSE